MGTVSFSTFTLLAEHRRLEQAGRPVRLGGRAFDILVVLVERAPEIVPKRELLKRVWPDVIVDDNVLRVHMTALRKALGEGEPGVTFIMNAAGRGYYFVAPVSRSPPCQQITNRMIGPGGRLSILPPRLARMVGRESERLAIASLLTQQRFVTIVGPGGVGKTTVAIAVAHSLVETLSLEVYFFDLARMTRPEHVVTTIATTFGIVAAADDPLPSLIAFLGSRHILLIFDSCEHVMVAVASLAERLFYEASSAHILATSREPLRVDGEQQYQLLPLACPPSGLDMKASDVFKYPAAQLFLDRVCLGNHAFELADVDAPLVIRICQKLDGIALALELAAGRVGAYGLAETAQLLDDRFTLLWRGRRTAVARHQTLSATLDWSYDLLDEKEQVVLRRLAVFVGYFTLRAAQSIAMGDDVGRDQVIDAVASLLGKSLLSTQIGIGEAQYRLLDTTRSYALEKFVVTAEADHVSRNHALFFLNLLERGETTGEAQPTFAEGHANMLANVRAALEWSFACSAGGSIRIPLSVSAARLLIQVSLLGECHKATERAIAALGKGAAEPRAEMQLQALRGQSLMFIRGGTQDVKDALSRSLALATSLNDPVFQLQLLGALHLFHERLGDYYGAHDFALEGERIARTLDDPAALVEAQSLLGISFHLLGEHRKARRNIQAVLRFPRSPQRWRAVRFGFDHQNRARIALARILWLQGSPVQAVVEARAAIEEAAGLAHPVTLCMALIWAVSVFFWIGDYVTADACVNRFIEEAEAHALGPYIAVARGMKGQLEIKAGKVKVGLLSLRNASAALDVARYDLLTTDFMMSEAEGLAMIGEREEAIHIVEETIARTEKSGNRLFSPELLRIRGELLASGPWPNREEADHCFRRSLALGREQHALSWELRTATSLARHKSRERNPDEAAALLLATYLRFLEGHNTQDLKVAKALLDQVAPTF